MLLLLIMKASTNRISLLALLFLLLPVYSFAQQVWTVEKVPNTRLLDNAIHVSDPDDLLSDSCEMRINTALSSIRDKADVFVVALSSIGETDIEKFAVDLFNRWEIGDAKTDNGVLMLLAKEQRKLKFETGYGAEAILTDARCQQIFTKNIVPYFKTDDYEGGLCAGVAEIVSIYDGIIPTGLVTTSPNYDSDQDDDTSGWSKSVLIILTGLLSLIALFPLFSNKGSHTTSGQTMFFDKTIDGIPYYNQKPLAWTGNAWEGKGCLRAILVGLSLSLWVVIPPMFIKAGSSHYELLCLLLTIFLYLTWMCLHHNVKTLNLAKKLALESSDPKSVYQKAYDYSLTRTTLKLAPWIAVFFRRKYEKLINESESCCCPECHTAMSDHEGLSFSENQMLETRLESMVYRPLRCSNGHIIVAASQGKHNGDYSVCENCGTCAVKVKRTRIITKATTMSEGIKEQESQCLFCGKESVSQSAIPKKETSYDAGYGGGYSSGSSSSSSSYGGGHSSGGSFGGGHSGGGGYTGSW